jgi:hypothetical protein
MNQKHLPQQSFTLRFKGIARELITPVKIAVAFNPETTDPNTIPHSQANALWDTGATNTGISATLAARLGLTPIGTGRMKHAKGEDDCNRYLVNLVLPNQLAIFGVMVNECDLPQEFDLLIGMDIISQGDFSLTHSGGNTIFSFRTPSSESVDYVKIQNAKAFAVVGANAPCPCGSGKKFKKCHRQ